jgi:hypothetical membrane protein
VALRNRDWQKIAGLALIIGPLEFAVATLVEGALIPGYGLITHWVSDLGAPPNNAPHFAPGTDLWWVFSATLILMSLLVFVGVIGLKPLLGDRRLGQAVLVLIVIVALGAIGVAVWNEVDALELHSVSALTAFGLGWLAMVLFGVYVRNEPRWKPGWSVLSLLGGAVSLLALVLYVVPTYVGRANVRGWVAAIYPDGSERAILLPLIVWLIALGVHLPHLAYRDDPSPAPTATHLGAPPT